MPYDQSTYVADRQHKLRRKRNEVIVPRIRHPKLHASCRNDLVKFCQTYLSNFFNLPFADFHTTVLTRIQDMILGGGGKFAFALPRGSGKTSILLASAIWALLYGHKRFVVILGASSSQSRNLFLNIRGELETNEKLIEDFPHLLVPLAAIQGQSTRTAAQTVKGKRTRIIYRGDHLKLPDGKKPGCGSHILAKGLSANIRGLLLQTEHGLIRPDLVIIDDPQNDAIAASQAQTQKLLDLIHRCVLGLSGSGGGCFLVSLTNITNNDVTSMLLRDPQWCGMRCQLVESFPERMDLWDNYHQLYLADLQDGGTRAKDFYHRHHEEMNKGASVSWQHRFNPATELDALEHAMRLYFQNRESFFSEYQNAPLDPTLNDFGYNLELLRTRCNGQPRATIPQSMLSTTAFIDVHNQALFYAVLSSDGQAFSVIDYGCYPPQKQSYYTLSQASPTLTDLYRQDTNASVLHGVSDLITQLLERDYPIEGGNTARINLLGIDCGFMSDPIFRTVQFHPHRSLILPTIGRYQGVHSQGNIFQNPRQGERVGDGWRLVRRNRPVRWLMFDSNYWKSRLSSFIRSPMSTGISFFGEDPNEHRLLFDHLLAETPVQVSSNGRTCIEWKQRGRQDQHFLDCLVGCLVLLSFLGVLTISTKRDKITRVGNTIRVIPPPVRI